MVVVEDETDIVTFVSAFFRASGLNVVHVNPRTPEEAADVVREHRPACVMLDMGLAGTTGLDVLARLRTSAATASVPVVVVTADARASTERAARAGGAAAFVTKPFDVRELFERVDSLVRVQ